MPKSAKHLPIRVLILLSISAIPVMPASAARRTSAWQDTVLTAAPVPDTAKGLRADTARSARAIADSLLAADSLGRMSTPSLVGTVDRSLDSSTYLTQRDMHFDDYRYLGELLTVMPGVFIFDQNSAGSYNQLSIHGVGWRSIAVSENGRPLNDPASGIYNLYHFTMEYADRIEFISGPRAFLYGLNSTGGAVNFVTRNYNSNRPFTKIDYSEGSYNYMYSDGTFSQNISRKINFTFGFQHQSTDGRYVNSLAEAWNMRVKLRYNVSRDFNIILSEYLTSTNAEMNGGLNLSATDPSLAYLPSRATVVNPDSYEKVTRHDVDLTLVGTFLADTGNVSTLTMYYSHNLREYREGEAGNSPDGVLVRSDHVSSWMGALFTQNLDAGFQKFSLGSTLELRQIEGSPNIGRRRNVIGALWAKEEIPLGGRVTLAGYGRYDNYLRGSYLGAGGDVSLAVSDGLELFGGASTSRRVPNYAELFWSDSTVSRSGPLVAERHWQSEAGVKLEMPGEGALRLALFHRTVLDPILVAPYGSSPVFPGLKFYNGGTLTNVGIDARLDMRIWVLTLEGTGMYLLQSSGGQTLREYPKLSMTGGIYYWNTVLEGKLDLKAGVRGRFTSSFDGDSFNPEVLAYVPNTASHIGYSSTLDFFLIAKLGDAFIHFMWTNLTDEQYLATPFYPGLDRELRIAIYWEFLN